MDGIGLIFVGMYILGRGVGTHALHFMGHFRSKVPELYVNLYVEALRWKLGHAPVNF